MMRILIVMVALVAGSIAGWLSLKAHWREPAEQVTQVVEAPTVDVLTPRVDLLRGARLEEAHLGWTGWPAGQVGPGMILREEQPGAASALAGRVLRSNLYGGEPLRMQHLSENAAGFLSLTLQPGMRAIGVQVSEEKTAGGFILPNDHVDVLHTVVRDLDGNGVATGNTRTVLTNVRVLAIGQTSFDRATLVVDPGTPEQAAGNGTTMTGSTATLEVTPEQAEVLLAAGASGQLSLALRAADDFGLSGIGDLAMLEGAAPAPVAGPGTAPAPEGPRQREITIVSAGVARTFVTSAEAVRNE